MSRFNNPFSGHCRPGLVAASILALMWGAARQSSSPRPAYTPLHAAAGAGDLDRVRALARAARCDIDARDALGETPLHYAALAGHADVVRWLLGRAAIRALGTFRG